jgi:hypothetical protein
MTDQQESAIRAVLAAAPEGALRRVLRQPVMLWITHSYVERDGCRCLIGTLENWRYDNRGIMSGALLRKGRKLAYSAFDSACATDCLPATVRRVKGWAREVLRERGR